jgi:hypothetical protein
VEATEEDGISDELDGMVEPELEADTDALALDEELDVALELAEEEELDVALELAEEEELEDWQVLDGEGLSDSLKTLM